MTSDSRGTLQLSGPRVAGRHLDAYTAMLSTGETQMKQLFGPVMQNAFVVDDLDATLEHWNTRMGVGPFYVFEHVQFQEAYVRGKPATFDMSAAIGYWGDLQIEFIKQHDDSPSIYREFKDQKLHGMQHMGVVTHTMDEDLRQLKERGIEPVQWGTMPTGMRFAYLNSDFHPGAMIELIQPVPAVADYFELMRKAAAVWDGTQGVIKV